MKKFFILENRKKEGSKAIGDKIENYLTERNCTCKRLDGFIHKEDIPEGTECVITIGGDGTLISAAEATAELELPVIGVNAGHLGYLTSISSEHEIPQMLQQLIEGSFKIIKNNTLKVNAGGYDVPCAINEVTVSKRSNLHVLRIKISVDGEFLNEYACDGIIIATPTGSTAYNLSAGGPVVESGMDAFVITPVCPHVQAAGSIVISGQSVVELEVIDDGSSMPVVTYDGREEIPIVSGTRVTISRGKYTIPLIRLGNETFISNLRKKMEML